MNTLNFTKGPRRVPKYKKIQLFAILNDLYKNCIKKTSRQIQFYNKQAGTELGHTRVGLGLGLSLVWGWVRVRFGVGWVGGLY